MGRVLVASVLTALATSSSAEVCSPCAMNWTDNFDYGIDENNWNIELTMLDGNGEFQAYVNSPQTTFVKNGILHLKPVLTENILNELHDIGLLQHSSKVRDPVAQGDSSVKADDLDAGPFTGRSAVLPFKHVRYQTPGTCVCNDTSSSLDCSQPNVTCPTNEAHATSVFDLSNQRWGGSAFQSSRCSENNGCMRQSGVAAQTKNGNTFYTMLPVVSAGRLNTNMKFDMKFGRLEFRAKLPRGDWLWPAMWMMPTYQGVYTDGLNLWPMSGEIDLAEARGNVPFRCGSDADQSGHNAFGSTLNWGDDYASNQWARTHTVMKFFTKTETLVDDFHTYGLFWNESHLYTYLDDDANHVLDLMKPTSQTFWNFAQSGTELCKVRNAEVGGDGDASCNTWGYVNAADWSGRTNIWANGSVPNMTPFDTPFHIILNLAVGDTVGFFNPTPPGCWGADGSPKPWSDDGLGYPLEDFSKHMVEWLPTWVDPENIAWAAHCALGSALDNCMPGNWTMPVIGSLTQDGVSKVIADFYHSAVGNCSGIHDEQSCWSTSKCEWRPRPCPPTSDNAALQIDSVKFWPLGAGARDAQVLHPKK